MRDVKICGLMRAEDVAAAIAAGASYLGFIVEAASKRRLTVKQAARIARPAKGIIPYVAVTVNASDALLARIMDHMQPDYIQCHGDESPDRVAEIARKFKVKTIKAAAISSQEDMQLAESYAGAADFILYDAKPPRGSKVRGGHGLSFDWSLLNKAPLPKIWALAGGLTLDNIDMAIASCRAPILDVSSGVEVRAGHKDHHKIQLFIAKAHGRGS